MMKASLEPVKHDSIVLLVKMCNIGFLNVEGEDKGDSKNMMVPHWGMILQVR